MIYRIHIPPPPLSYFIEHFFYYEGHQGEQKIKKFLKSKKLKELIKKIDSARYSNKLKILNEKLKEDTHFFGFITEMLKEIGFIDDKGRFDFKN